MSGNNGTFMADLIAKTIGTTSTNNPMTVNMNGPNIPESNVYQPTYGNYQHPLVYNPTNPPYNDMANIMAGMHLVNYNPNQQLSGLSGLSQLGIGAPQTMPQPPTLKG